MKLLALAIAALLLVPAAAAGKTLVGTPGKDRLRGGNSGNVINGDGGGDKLYGGAGADRLLGEWGGDDLFGFGGNDHLEGSSGGDLLFGHGGNDHLRGGFGGDRMTGGPGDDYINGEAAGDDIDGGAGNDELHGGTATDRIHGGLGDDVIHSTTGGDLIDAGEGNDVVWVNNGTAVDTVDCGPGHDVLHVNPLEMTGGWSNAKALREGRLTNCERIVETAPVVDPAQGIKVMTADAGGRADGTDRNDNLLGSWGPDTIIGLGGDDIIWANRKPDGRAHGTDRVEAGAGNDIVYGASRGGTTHIDGGDGDDYLQGGGAVATNFITGGAGADTIRLTGDGYNRVWAGEGDDIVYGYSKDASRIDCGPGNDYVKIGYNRRIRTTGCEKVTRRYRR